MRRYIVTEGQLEALVIAAMNHERRDDLEGLQEAEAACKSQPVPDWVTEFAGPVSDEYEENDRFSVHRKLQEIK